jgi:outer membrane lipase/esterase
MKLNVKEIARAALCAGSLAAAALLASCGGGEQVSSFSATRVIAFGDETSVLTASGKKYTVNALLSGSSTAVDCTSNPIWTQIVAANYGLVFPQCNSTDVPNPVSFIWATNGALVADITTQIDSQVNAGGFAAGDLVTVLVGVNDVVAQFQQYPGVGEDQLSANMTVAGAALAAQVNRLAGYGAKVLISTIPNVGLTPFAGDRTAGSTNGNPAILSQLSIAFNNALLANLLNDGHQIGLIQIDEYLTAVDTASINGTTGAAYVNTIDAACTVALPNCTTNTLNANAVNSTWLWADNLHVGANGQAALGSLALTRARNNPF